MILQVFMAFWGTLGIAVIFNVPKQQLIYSGIVGACSWLVYSAVLHVNASMVVATFFATVCVTAISRVLTRIRKMPITVFLLSGIIPLVPGIGIYGAVYSMILGDMAAATEQGIYTFKIAGVIGVGIMTILSLPISWFSGDSLRKRQ